MRYVIYFMKTDTEDGKNWNGALLYQKNEKNQKKDLSTQKLYAIIL